MERLELEVERGPAAGQRYSLEGGWTIGSGEAGPGALGGDRWLSPEHARIAQSPDGWTVQDLRSAEGTRVNGRVAREPIVLKPGDAIETGSSRIVVLPPDVPALSELPEAKEARDSSALRNENRRGLDSRRLGAVLVDAVVMLAPYLLLRAEGTLVAVVVAVALSLTYCFACESLWGQTAGKAVFGLRVVRLDGRPLTPQAVSIRTVLRLLDQTFACLVGMLTMVLTRGRRQRLGDLAAGTVVTRAQVPFKRAPLAGRNLFALLAYPLVWLAPAAGLYTLVPEATMHPCNDAQSHVVDRGEGSCLVAGGVVTVANAGHTLHLQGLDLALSGAKVGQAPAGRVAVMIQVALTNHTSSTLDVNRGLGVMLIALRDDGTEGVVRRDFSGSRAAPIQPGATGRPWFKFNVPATAVGDVTARGAELAFTPPADERHVGMLQLGRASTLEGARILARLQDY